jgi:beta-glucosidase
MNRCGLITLVALVVSGQAAAQVAKKDDDDLKAKIKASRGALKSTEPITTGGADYHKNFMTWAKQKQYKVVFFGASDVAGWGTTGREVWKKNFEPLNAGFFGAGEQPIGHLLWRLQHGLLDGYEPAVVVLGAGPPSVNALFGCAAKDIAEGIKECVQEIHKRQPKAKVIVLLPPAFRFSLAKDDVLTRVREVNQIVAKMDNGKTVRVLDPTREFVANQDALQKELDRVRNPHHLTLGYEIFAKVLKKPIEDMLK